MPQAFGFIAGLVGFGSAGMLGGALYGGWIAGAAFGSTIVGGLVANLLTSVAISALQSALTPNRSQGGGLTISTTLRGEQNPETIILGRYATAGQAICPPYSHGKSNRHLTHVIELCSMPGATLERIIINDEYVEIGAEPRAGSEHYGLPLLGDYDGNAWIKYYDGTQTAADPMLVDKYGTHEDRPWTDDMVGAGICYAILTFYFDDDVFSGVPRYRFEMRGAPLYDPRRDGTAGGLGPQRLNDPATWTQTDNPMVIAWNIFRGIRLPGGNIWGGGVEPASLPNDVWFAAMNACDVPVTLAGGGTEPRYRCGLEVALTQEPAATLEEILKAASATVADVGYGWKVHVGAPGLPVMSITDDDILVSATQELDPFPSLSDTYNAVTAQYPDPESLWETKDAPPRYNAAWEASDVFGRRAADLQLPAVPYKRQVQRLMRAWIEDERRFRRHMFSLPPDAAILEPLDTLDYSSVRNGYEGKDFSIAEITEDLRTGLRQVSIRERNPADYDWSPTDELPSVPTVPGTTVIPEGVSGFSVQGILLTDGAGQPRRSGLKIVWDGGLLARGLRWQIRRAGTSAVILRGGTQDIEGGEHVQTEGIIPGQTYEVRARLIASRLTVWSGWIAATAPALKLGPDDLDWSELETEILEQLSTLEDWINSEFDLAEDAISEAEAEIAALTAEQAQQAADLAQQASDLAVEAAARGDLAVATAQHYRDLARSVQTIRDYVAELDYQSYTAREELRRQIGAVVEGYAATFDERITVAASATGAIAERVTVLEAESVDLGARIIEVDTARVDSENALAQQIAAVSVGTNTQFDQSNIWYFDTATEGWTGSPSNPTAAGGYLRPASGSGAWVASPAGLAVDTQVYSQVRARLRRVGSPTWAGVLWWQAAGQGWAAGRSIAVAEPTWVDGISDITVTPDWSGTLDQIRLDLAAAPDASNRIEIDWVAIGRPSPGASRAELVAERTARISADTAQALAITELEASLTDLEDETTATANAVQALDGRVTSAEGLLTAQATAITGLQSDLGGKASATAVSELTTEVSELSDGLSSQSAAVVALRNSIDPLAAEGLDAQFAAFLADGSVREALATADEALRTEVQAQGDAVVVLAEKVTSLEAAMPGLASSTALNALTTRVTVAEAAITSQASAITALQSDVAGKASASALTSLTTRVTSAENLIVSQSAAITSLQSDVAGKASASAVGSLTTRVTTAEAAITSQASAITSLQSDVAGKASASAVSSLTTRVTTAEAALVSQSSALTSLQNDVAGKAATSALNSLTTRVTTAEAAITSQASAITSLQSDVAGKASASALATLDTKVTSVETTATGKNKVFRASTAPTATSVGDIWFNTAEDSKCYRWGGSTWVSVQDGNIPTLIATTTAQSNAITALQNDLAGKASASALTALTTRVTTAEGQISGQATALTALNTTVGKFAAGGRFRVRVEATPAGATSRIGLSATASDGADTQTAALFLEATSSGDSRVLVRADRFAIINGSARDVPFIVDSGSTYIKKALIKEADIDTLKIAGNAITVPVRTFAHDYLEITSDNSWVTVADLSIRRQGIATELLFTCSLDGYGSGVASFRLVRGSSTVVRAASAVTGERGRQAQVAFAMIDWDEGTGITRYRLQCKKTDPQYTAGWNANLRVFRRYFSAIQFRR